MIDTGFGLRFELGYTSKGITAIVVNDLSKEKYFIDSLGNLNKQEVKS